MVRSIQIENVEYRLLPESPGIGMKDEEQIVSRRVAAEKPSPAKGKNALSKNYQIFIMGGRGEEVDRIEDGS